MGSLYKLITKTNLKSPTLAFPLVMPVIFLLLYSTGVPGGLSQEVMDARVALFFTTILSITTMQSGLMGFGINFITLKKSVMLKRIGATELTKTDVILATALFGLTLWLISFIFIIIVISLLSLMHVYSSEAGISIINNVAYVTDKTTYASMFGWMEYISWGKLTYATIVMLYTSYGLGLLFTSSAKDEQSYMGLAMLYFFFAGFIGGLMFPGDIPLWMNDIGYLIPHSYIGNIYDWVAGGDITIWNMKNISDGIALLLSTIIPIFFGTIFIFAAIKTLKFD